MLKLHLGCGTVYLKGYVNIDIDGRSAKLYPHLKRHNQTTPDRYFKYPFRVNLGNDCYDVKMDILDLSAFEDNSVDEILAVNVVEHLELSAFLKAAEEHWWRVLKPNGLMILDVPDMIKMSQGAIDAHKAGNMRAYEKYVRWIYCHGRTEYDKHRWGWTEEYLTHMLELIEFKFIKRDDSYINHDAGYPWLVCFYRPVK